MPVRVSPFNGIFLTKDQVAGVTGFKRNPGLHITITVRAHKVVMSCVRIATHASELAGRALFEKEPKKWLRSPIRLSLEDCRRREEGFARFARKHDGKGIQNAKLSHCCFSFLAIMTNTEFEAAHEYMLPNGVNHEFARIVDSLQKNLIFVSGDE
jgi:hypothetical protein